MVLASTYCRSGISTSVSKSECIAGSASTDDKTPTVQHKPVMGLASGNNALAHYSNVATIKYHMHYPILMAYRGAAVIFLTSYCLNTGKLPDCFFYKQPRYEYINIQV